MSVARAYVPLSGSQVYVLPARVTTNAQDLATAAARWPEPGVQVSCLPQRQGPLLLCR